MALRLEDLEVYNLASEISDEIWTVASTMPNFEKYTIGQQMVRSADSISANIAEGYGRYSFKENKNFCLYARGSLIETKDWIGKCKRRNIIGETVAQDIFQKMERLNKQLNAYIKSIGPKTDI
ncbi:MAG: four helix bundle protein [Runella slithyformis]|nr:MAG: four helix bundle protein [Runella slithyformis]TAE91011.1 MAG: four helix bundle protein [Runella slithyformis]TAF29001.1 MAG: four helix bundle protein [Runella slithyformis]TAF46460.1 MAG: four helix bundle protein [Runella slithyformis]TAF82595.1 MAG: four helix bundle protein [Runella slithyformis]